MKYLDSHAKFIWISLDRNPPINQLYIAVCYFPPPYSSHAMTSDRDLPYLDIFLEIYKFSTLGDIQLVDDFNAHIGIAQCSIFDIHLD